MHCSVSLIRIPWGHKIPIDRPDQEIGHRLRIGRSDRGIVHRLQISRRDSA